MDASKVDLFITTKSEYFLQEQLPFIREKLLEVDETKWGLITVQQFKSPTTALILSLVLGVYGVDRFYIGDTGLGVGKLVTCGGLGFWTIIDWFLISNATREKNYSKLMMVL